MKKLKHNIIRFFTNLIVGSSKVDKEISKSIKDDSTLSKVQTIEKKDILSDLEEGRITEEVKVFREKYYDKLKQMDKIRKDAVFSNYVLKEINNDKDVNSHNLEVQFLLDNLDKKHPNYRKRKEQLESMLINGKYEIKDINQLEKNLITEYPLIYTITNKEKVDEKIHIDMLFNKSSNLKYAYDLEINRKQFYIRENKIEKYCSTLYVEDKDENTYFFEFLLPKGKYFDKKTGKTMYERVQPNSEFKLKHFSNIDNVGFEYDYAKHKYNGLEYIGLRDTEKYTILQFQSNKNNYTKEINKD